MKALFFILYAYLFIRGIVLLFKKPKQGTSKMQAHKKQRMFKLLFVLLIMVGNAVLIILTDSFINILNIEHVLSFWIWLNGFGILLIELPWYGKYDISMGDLIKNQDKSKNKSDTDKSDIDTDKPDKPETPDNESKQEESPLKESKENE